MAGKTIKELRPAYQPEKVVATIMRSSTGLFIVFIMFNLLVSIASANYASYGNNEATPNFHDQVRPNEAINSSVPFSSNNSHKMRHKHHQNYHKNQQKQTDATRQALNSFKSFNKLSGRSLSNPQNSKIINSLNNVQGLKSMPRQNETLKHQKTAPKQSNYVNHSSSRSYSETPNKISFKKAEEIAWTKNVPSSQYTSNQLQQHPPHNLRHQNHIQNRRMKEEAPFRYNYDSATTLATPINHRNHQNFVHNRNRSHSSPWRPNNYPSYMRTVTTTTTTVKYDDDYEEEYEDDIEPNDEANVGSRSNRGAEALLETTTESLTDEKWRKFGTRDAVTNERRNFLRDEQRLKQRQAGDHYELFLRESKCKIPKKKVVYLPTRAHKTYTPRATVLYRCGDDTACCQSVTQSCVAKHNAKVRQMFVVHTLTSNGSITTYESLTFTNETECHCVERIPTQAPPASLSQLTCKCPAHFNVTFDREDDSCRCECPERPRHKLHEKTVCETIAEGEGFSVDDRRCIRDKRCGIPICKYGSFNKRDGRCPSIEDKININ